MNKLKGIVQAKIEICYHLLTLKLFQTCMNFFYILKNDRHCLPLSFFSIHTLLKTHSSLVTWGRVNDEEMFMENIFVWNKISLNCVTFWMVFHLILEALRNLQQCSPGKDTHLLLLNNHISLHQHWWELNICLWVYKSSSPERDLQ